MEERPAVEVAVIGADAYARARGPRVAQHAVVREHRALGIGGGTRGELDEQQVVRLYLDGNRLAAGESAGNGKGVAKTDLAQHRAEIDAEEAPDVGERLAIGLLQA